MSENTGILLETKDLSKYFTAKKGLLNRNPSVVKAVDHVSLSVRKGETLGLVGESGCGKSTLGRTILRLIPATEGQVMYNGEDILTYDKKKMWEMRRKLQIIFQDRSSANAPNRSENESVTGDTTDLLRRSHKASSLLSPSHSATRPRFFRRLKQNKKSSSSAHSVACASPNVIHKTRYIWE